MPVQKTQWPAHTCSAPPKPTFRIFLRALYGSREEVTECLALEWEECYRHLVEWLNHPEVKDRLRERQILVVCHEKGEERWLMLCQTDWGHSWRFLELTAADRGSIQATVSMALGGVYDEDSEDSTERRLDARLERLERIRSDPDWLSNPSAR